MDLSPYVESLQRQLVVAAEAGGDEARAVGERLIAPLEAAVRLTLLSVLSSAAEEITCDLAPGSVEVRLRGGSPEFAVTAPPVDRAGEDDDDAGRPRPAPIPPVDGEEGGMSRINLRMPDHLKVRIEAAAAREGLSVNAWLVRTVTAAVERAGPPGRPGERRAPQGAQRYTGWAR